MIQMFGGIGSTEVMVLLILFFILFGAERLPKLARAMGESKGEFQQGLDESRNKTLRDLESGGRTPSQALAERARNLGIDPTGMEVAELEKKVAALESLEEE